MSRSYTIIQNGSARSYTINTGVGPAGAGSTWGGIAGTLADQTDLQAALDAKASITSVNSAFSTWTGNTSIMSVGTITVGTWQGTTIADTYIASAATWNAKAPTHSPTFTGDATFANVNVANIQSSGAVNGFQAAFDTTVTAGGKVSSPSFYENLDSVVATSGTIPITKQRTEIAIDGTTTFELPDTGDVSSLTIIVTQGALGEHETLFDAGGGLDTLTWADGTPDTTTAVADQIDIYSFIAVTGGWVATRITITP